MKVKITGSINIADSHPSMPIAKVVEGEVRDDLSDHVANRLIELKYAKLADEIDKESNRTDDAQDKENDNTSDATDDNSSDAQDAESTDETDNSDATGDDEGDAEEGNSDDADAPTPESLKAELEGYVLKGMEDPMGNEQKIKAMLEELGKERYSFDVDKRMGVDNIIKAIVEAAFKE